MSKGNGRSADEERKVGSDDDDDDTASAEILSWLYVLHDKVSKASRDSAVAPCSLVDVAEADIVVAIIIVSCILSVADTLFVNFMRHSHVCSAAVSTGSHTIALAIVANRFA